MQASVWIYKKQVVMLHNVDEMQSSCDMPTVLRMSLKQEQEEKGGGQPKSHLFLFLHLQWS
jgi:hypothetical protein